MNWASRSYHRLFGWPIHRSFRVRYAYPSRQVQRIVTGLSHSIDRAPVPKLDLQFHHLNDRVHSPAHAPPRDSGLPVQNVVVDGLQQPANFVTELLAVLQPHIVGTAGYADVREPTLGDICCTSPSRCGQLSGPVPPYFTTF